MFSDTVFMDSMLPAHRLNPFQVKNTATTNRGRGRGCYSLGYCCTCTDTKNLNSNCVVCEMSIRTVVPQVFNILGSDIYMALISVIAKKGAWALE